MALISIFEKCKARIDKRHFIVDFESRYIVNNFFLFIYSPANGLEGARGKDDNVHGDGKRVEAVRSSEEASSFGLCRPRYRRR